MFSPTTKEKRKRSVPILLPVTVESWRQRISYVLLVAGLALAFLVMLGMRGDTLPYPPNSDYSDAAVSHYPNALYLRQSVQSGTSVLWRPLLMSGQPFAANPLNKVWYPPQWLALILPTTVHLNVMVWLHMVVAGLGMRALGRTLGLREAIAGVVGVAYMFMPRMMSALGAGHLDVLYAMAWCPALLWAALSTIRAQQWSGQRVAILGAIAALCFLADIRMFAIILLPAAVLAWWAVAQLPPPTRVRAVLQLSAAALLCIGLTAVQWLLLLEILPDLSRNGLTQADAGLFSLLPAQFLGVLLPVGIHETILYSGIILLIMVIIGTHSLWRRHQRGFAGILWGLILFAALYGLGVNGILWNRLTTLFPPLLWLRVPPRLWWIAVLALVVLAGYGLQSLRNKRLALILGGVMIAEVMIADTQLATFRSSAQWRDPYAPIAEALLQDGVSKFYSPSYALPQQASAYWQIPDFGGVDPFQLRSYLPAFEAATGTKTTGYTVTLPPYTDDPHTSNREANIDAAQLARWGVSHVVANYPIVNDGLRLLQEIDGVYIYRNRNDVIDQPSAETMCVGEVYCYFPPLIEPGIMLSVTSLLVIGLLLMIDMLLWRRRHA